jgi:hypothetical protein
MVNSMFPCVFSVFSVKPGSAFTEVTKVSQGTTEKSKKDFNG